MNTEKKGEANMIEYEAMMYSILKKYGLYNKREDYIDLCYIGYAKGIKKYDSTKSKETTTFTSVLRTNYCNAYKKKMLKKGNDKN